MASCIVVLAAVIIVSAVKPSSGTISDVGEVRRHQPGGDLDHAEQQRGTDDEPQPDPGAAGGHQRAGQRADRHRPSRAGRTAVAPLSKTWVAIRAEVIWKFSPKVPAKNTDAQDQHQVGTTAQVAHARRGSCPCGAPRAGAGCRSATTIARSASSTAP